MKVATISGRDQDWGGGDSRYKGEKSFGESMDCIYLARNEQDNIE